MDRNNDRPAPTPGERQTRARITRPVQDALGERLRAMYDGLKAERVPERLLDLLKHLGEPQSGQP